MSGAAWPAQHGGEHASEEAYRVFLQDRNIKGRVHLYAYRCFVEAYPDLQAWFEAPLATRLHEAAERGTATASTRTLLIRPYLLFLVNTERATLDWPWIIGARRHPCRAVGLPDHLELLIDKLCGKASELGLASASHGPIRRWVKYLHLSGWRPGDGLKEGLDEAAGAVEAFGARADLERIGAAGEWPGRARQIRAELFNVRGVAFHLGLTTAPPAQRVRVSAGPIYTAPPAMATLITRYRQTRVALGIMPSTAAHNDVVLRRFAAWAASRHGLQSFADVTRDQVLEYLADLRGKFESQISEFSALNVFFRLVTGWGWEGAPSRPLLADLDLPKRPTRLPRYIPADQLERLLSAIRKLECPLQRAALLTARWSGARRSEIRWLEIDCVDSFTDGTPRLRIPAGKTRTERMVPLHPEAAEALRVLMPMAQGHRGFRDPHGRVAKRLFVKAGRLCSNSFLFDEPLARITTELGMYDAGDGMAVTAHRFRHTVGTELAEGGARLHTIMKMLGHTSTGMTLVYAHISDQALKADYSKVLGPGAVVAGGLADALRRGDMTPASIDWMKKNFFRTELELGHCLRLPEEGPCECDLYLNCAKFVTTPEYAPRLRERRKRELELIERARAEGWSREVERHDCTLRRIDQLLAELGEPVADVGALI
ncbi:tyrosine-type recombinase/integrase [Methylosinus sporium]|nr:tyrosine-type recombinase/integrase [Methylosinus sporium]